MISLTQLKGTLPQMCRTDMHPCDLMLIIIDHDYLSSSTVSMPVTMPPKLQQSIDPGQLYQC